MDAQLRAMREHCDRLGWAVIREYVAPGESAYTSDLTKRPVLAEVVGDAEAGKFDVLLIHESSRLARNEQLAQSVLDRLTAAGVTLRNVANELDYTSPEGRMFYGMEATLNAYWSRKMGQHIAKGFAEKFAKGLPVGSLPFGYRHTTPGEPPEPVHEEADAIREAFQARGRGVSMGAIAQALNDAGLVPRSRRGARVSRCPRFNPVGKPLLRRRHGSQGRA